MADCLVAKIVSRFSPVDNVRVQLKGQALPIESLRYHSRLHLVSLAVYVWPTS